MTSTFNRFQRTTLLVLALSGCATTIPDPYGFAKAISPDQAVAMASEATGIGNAERAMAILAEAKKTNPTSKELWLKSAQINFDAANYALAVSDAQEVLQRDPKDKVAHGLIVVSGLRLSTQSIAELVKLESLDGGTRGEAEKLARSLRESLGEIVLVPTPAASSSGTGGGRSSGGGRNRPAKPTAPAADAPPKAEAAKPAKPAEPAACPPGNPFCGL